MSYIYLITNTVNGKQYVGQHKYGKPGIDENYHGSGVALKSAYEKYGRDNFTIEILEECDDSLLNELENKYITEYDTLCPKGYNITEGGGFYDTMSNNPNKEEIFKRVSDGNKRYNLEHPGRLAGENNGMYGKGYLVAGENNGFYGKTHTDEYKARLRKMMSGEGNPQYGKRGELATCYGRCGDKHPMYGKHHTEETKKHISDVMKGVPKRNEKLLQLDPVTDEIIREWDNAAQIGDETDWKPHTVTTIARRAATEGKTAYGYRWIWKSDYDKLMENGQPLPKLYKKSERRKRPVLQIEPETNEVIREWPSAADVKNELGYSNSAILRCCRGDYKTSYNCIWRYKDE